MFYPYRFVPDKGFAGADSSRRRDGPVQFEREEEEDVFGLDNFFKTVKKADKRQADERNRDDYERGSSSSSKRRKDY